MHKVEWKVSFFDRVYGPRNLIIMVPEGHKDPATFAINEVKRYCGSNEPLCPTAHLNTGR